MTLEYKYKNFYEIIENNAKIYPNKKAILSEEITITHNELKKKIDNFSAFLKTNNVAPEDKIAIILGNSVEFIISFFAITKLGAIAIPINTFLKHEEFEYILDDCNASMLITSSQYKPEVKDLIEKTCIKNIVWCDDQEPSCENNFNYETIMKTKFQDDEENYNNNINALACIIYTSGTTGKPKGAMLSYKNILSNVISADKIFNIKQKDRFIVYLPMFHAFTLTVMILLPSYTSSGIVLVKSVFPFGNVLKQTLLKRVTIFLGVPTVYTAMLHAKIPWYFMWFNKIRLFISGSAPLSDKAIKDFKNKFTRGTLIEGYGLSECSPAVAINLPTKQKSLSVGPAMIGYEIKIVNEEMVEVQLGEVGEIIVKGDCVMQGYYNRPDATDETIVNGWLLTGDLGRMDEDGFVFIVDRKKDLIISKGINIYPREIEEVLLTHESIDASAVIGVKDGGADEVAIAFIQLKEDAEEISEIKIKGFLKEHLANFKIPKHIYLVEELPRNATGKVLKRVLKEEVDEGKFLKK